MNNPLDAANLAEPALDGIIRALSDRPNQTEAERLIKANAALTLILSFQPRDVIEMTLAGQTVLFNELLAGGVRDVLRGTGDTTKQPSHSSLVSMGRVFQGHLDRLERRGNRPYRTEVAATSGIESRMPRRSAAIPARSGAVTAARRAARPEPFLTTSPEWVNAGSGLPAGETTVESSWLDAPYEQWLIEIPADLSVKTTKPTMRMKSQTGSAPPGATRHDAEPLLPRLPAGYSPARKPAITGPAAGD